MVLRYQTLPPTPEEYFALFETTGWNAEYHLRPINLAKALASSWFMVSAYDDDRLVGFGRVVTDQVHAMIYDLIVAPDHQQQGIGSEILKRLVKRCLEAGVRDIQLFCAAGKRAFYEKRSFVASPDDRPGMEYQGATAHP